MASEKLQFAPVRLELHFIVTEDKDTTVDFLMETSCGTSAENDTEEKNNEENYV